MNAPATILPDVVSALLGQLEARMVEGVLSLNGPTDLHPLSTSALRGLLGHALKDAGDAEALRLFKPPASGAPPFVIQPQSFRTAKADFFSFRIFAWDPDSILLDAFASAAAAQVAGRPFGQGRIRVEGIRLSAPERLVFSGIDHDGGPIRLRLATPLCLKAYDRSDLERPRKRLLQPENLTLRHLLDATHRRISNLTAHPVDPLRLDPETLPEPTSRSLRIEGTARKSSTQRNRVSLQGITGHLDFSELCPLHAELLSLASVFHLGHHPVEGCGLLLLEPPAK